MDEEGGKEGEEEEEETSVIVLLHYIMCVLCLPNSLLKDTIYLVKDTNTLLVENLQWHSKAPVGRG